VGPSTRWVLLKELQLRNIATITQATMKEIDDNHVVYTDSQGNDVTLLADTVVLAMGSRPEASLAKKLEQVGVDVRLVGDANKCGRIGNAIEDGFKLACEV